VGTPDRRTALRVGISVVGTAAASAMSACSDASRARPATAAQPLVAPTRSSPPSTAPVTPHPESAPPPSELSSAPSSRPQVALTFHGDGDPKLTRDLLAEAERADARLTVLAVGRWLGEHPELARRVLDGGHELGNHTEHHADITAMSPAAAYAEIQACADRLRRLTGTPGRWFRPSQTQHASPAVVAQARRAGYETVLSYDVDPLDYQDPPAPTTVERFLAQVHPGAVVSLHLGHPGTVTALPAMLDGLHRRGLAAVTASQLFAGT
jgi:peptidoglycan/xylan/chitin deacetylase (PgdA/CDA1 family)